MQNSNPKLKMESKEVNPERRKFLKVLLIGGGGFLLGRLLKPITKLFSSSSFEVNNSFAQTGPPVDEAGSDLLLRSSDVSPLIEGSGPAPPEGQEQETDFKNFKVIEKKESMVFIDKKANEEILILDWGAGDTDKDK